MIKLRIILETKEDVIREIAISKQENLEQLHHSIIKHFKQMNLKWHPFTSVIQTWNQEKKYPFSILQKMEFHQI